MAAASFEELRQKDKDLFTGLPYRLLFKIPVCSFAEHREHRVFYLLGAGENWGTLKETGDNL